MASTATAALPTDFLLHIRRDIDIDAPLAVVFEALLEQIGPGNDMPDGTPMPMKLEPWPGGRWFRDLGNNTGHLWGHVMVIKPPTLLEITGPLCMSYAATSHVQYRLTQQDGRTRLAFTHRAIGEIAPEHRSGMPNGWGHQLSRVKERSTR
jgi:Activator of Hsp90 ATPase homolog 1-like protein